MANKRFSELPAAGTLTLDELIALSQPSASVTITAATIAAVASGNKLTDSGSGFVSAGFTAGKAVVISGFTGDTDNNGFAVVSTVAAGELVITGLTLTDDAAGESVTITQLDSVRVDLATLAAAIGGGDAADVTYTPTTLADWDSSTDPGDAADALDQLAARVTEVEGATGVAGQYPADGTPGTDDTWQGRAITGVNAGATIAQWEAVYMGSGGEWLLADASADTTAPARGIAIEAGTDNNPMGVLTEGVVRNDAWAWTPGGALYLSETAGALTQTAPTTSGAIVQQVGWAISADVAYIAIGDATYIEVA